MDAIELPGSLTPGQATAWILTRDEAFTLQSQYGSSLRVEICFNAWKPADGSFPFKSADKAGQELLDRVNSWAIEARGTPFRREAPDGQFAQCGGPDGVISGTYLAWDAEDNLWLVSEDRCLQFRDVSINTAGLLREFPAAPVPKIQRGKSSGRPPKYDWPAFEAEGLRLLAMERNWIPAELERSMADWCENAWGEQPAHSVLQDRINRILRKAA